jgi:hypothetical protein
MSIKRIKSNYFQKSMYGAVQAHFRVCSAVYHLSHLHYFSYFVKYRRLGEVCEILSHGGLSVRGRVKIASDYTVRTLNRSYFKGSGANIELQVYSVTCC